MSSRQRKWKFRLRNIVESINRINQYTAGFSFDQFVADPKTFDAVVRNLIIIGEVARQIPPELETVYPELPWTERRALRIFLIPEYDRVEENILWDTIRNDLPPLVPLLERVLRETVE